MTLPSVWLTKLLTGAWTSVPQSGNDRFTTPIDLSHRNCEHCEGVETPKVDPYAQLRRNVAMNTPCHAIKLIFTHLHTFRLIPVS